MRAYEFITEQDNGTVSGKLLKRQQHPTVGLNVFAISQYDRTYDLNRVMMAVAATDGRGAAGNRPHIGQPFEQGASA